MSKRKAYSIEFLQRIKAANPNYVFEGEDLKAWNEFTEKEKQAEESFFKTLNETEEEFKKKKTPKKKVQQVVEPTETESLDIEVNEEASEESA